MRQLHNKNITNYLKNSIYNYDISKKKHNFAIDNILSINY
mgnify:CR=1 FL=1